MNTNINRGLAILLLGVADMGALGVAAAGDAGVRVLNQRGLAGISTTRMNVRSANPVTAHQPTCVGCVTAVDASTTALTLWSALAGDFVGREPSMPTGSRPIRSPETTEQPQDAPDLNSGRFPLLPLCANFPYPLNGNAAAARPKVTGGDDSVLMSGYRAYIAWVSGLSPRFFFTVLRCAVALVLPTILCTLALLHLVARLPRGVMVPFQWALALLGLFVSLELPIESLEFGPVDRAWYFAFAVFGNLILPCGLSFCLLPHAGARRILAAVIYVIVGLVLALSIHQPQPPPICPPSSVRPSVTGYLECSPARHPPIHPLEDRQSQVLPALSPDAVFRDPVQPAVFLPSPDPPRKLQRCCNCRPSEKPNVESSSGSANRNQCPILLKSGSSPDSEWSFPGPRSFWLTVTITSVAPKISAGSVTVVGSACSVEVHAGDVDFFAAPTRAANSSARPAARPSSFAQPVTRRPALHWTTGLSSSCGDETRRGDMKPRPNPQGRNRLEEGLKRLGFLKQQGVNPFHDLNATMAEGDGFELPDLTHQHLDRAALLSSLKPYEPEPVPPGLSIPCGVDVNTGKAVHLNVETMDNVILAGATKTGKNNGACHLLAGWLRLGKRGEVIAQKGDEFEMATRFPGAVYLPLDLEPWNDWTVIGPDRHAFWTANAEAIAIPTGLKEQTFPEIPIIAEQMYRSDPHFPWIALVKTLQWKARQPGGREKHETAAGCLATYAAAIGDRAYVERGIDIRERYPLIVWGYHKYDLLQAEVALGLRFVREKFDALRRGHSRQPVRVLFIPEGQLLFSREIEALRRGNFSYLSRFFTMANSLGIRIWIACQSVTRISSYVLNNCPTLLVYRQDELRSAEICAESLGLTPEVAPELMLLPPGVCYVKTPGWDRPCKVRMEQVVPDTHPTEANIRNHFKDEYDRLRAQATYAQPDNHVASIDWRSIVDGGASVGRAASKTPVPLLHDHYLLLREILANPTAGLKTHYDQVGGWGIPRGNRTLAELRRVGAVTVRKEKTANPKGGGGRLIASVTPLGRTLLAAFERQNSKS